MANLNFVPTSCQLRVDVTPEQGTRGALALTGRLERDADGDMVELSNGDYLEKLDGYFTLVDAGTDQSKGDKAIGHLYYTKEEEPKKGFYQLQVDIPIRQFTAVHEAVNQGRLPSGISIGVEGVSFDFPSHATWDTRKNDELPIRFISISIPIIGDKPHNFFDVGKAKKRRNKG